MVAVSLPRWNNLDTRTPLREVGTAAFTNARRVNNTRSSIMWNAAALF